jgi:uncharacterized protein with von Willebrand factor type A (vWA) domain
MDKVVLNFIDSLRASGVRISLSENIDCFHALEVLGVEDKPTFKTSLRSTLIKKTADIPTFEKLFEMYFTALTRPLLDDDFADDEMGEMPFGSMTIQDFLDSLLEEDPGLLENLAMLMQTDFGTDFQLAMMKMGTHAGLSEISNPLQVGFFAKRIRDSLGWNMLSEELDALRERLTGQGHSPEEVDRLIEYIQQKMKKAFEAIKEFVRRELDKNMRSDVEKWKRDELLDKSFYQLTKRDIELMRDIVARLGRKLKDKAVLRNKRKKKGRIDVKRVIRRNMQYGGVPIELCYKNRRIEKPHIVTLCDISDSVSYAAQFMLQFLYTMQELFSKVRTFVFVTQIAEVTQLFSENDIDAAIDLAFHSRYVDYNGHSNFGYAFHRFRDEFLDSITPRTTVIIVGDARNNRNDPRTWAFKDIAEKAKRVIWLNPEARTGWKLGDSVMYEYMAHCDEVHECRNARQLTRVIDKIISR